LNTASTFFSLYNNRKELEEMITELLLKTLGNNC